MSSGFSSGGLLLFGLSDGFLGSGLVGLDGFWEVEGVLGVFLEEGDEALKGAVALVVNEVLGASGLELERREALDTEGNSGREVVLGNFKLGTRGDCQLANGQKSGLMRSTYMTTLSLMAAYFSPSWSQIGARRLQ